ncbi:hypothetical protein ACL6C3_19890 [Capilliphycus salinus ALCB114379]|uniref:hypothetical protein n=1 Tax=Capilliphycus salinus TaxID=2768948 RepID=UPI0039A467C3
MSSGDSANCCDDTAINNFLEFIYCLNEHTKTRGCSDRLVSYLTHYYGVDQSYYRGEYKELFKNFSADEVSQLIAQLCNKQGEPIFKSEEIDILISAREFALSDDPKKRIDYLCTIELEFSRYNSDEPFKILATVKVNCISNEYLKMSEDEDEYYQDYLWQVAEHKLEQKYPSFIDQVFAYHHKHGHSYSLIEYKALP